MSPTLSTALIFGLALSFSPIHGGRWLTLGNDSSVQVLPVMPMRTFWLRPSGVLLSSRVASDCRPPQLRLRVALWSTEALFRARKAVLARGLCGENNKCEVLPLPAVRVALRDEAGRWVAPLPWARVPAPVPVALTLTLGRERTNQTADNCTGSQDRSLTADELWDLAQLVLVVQSRSPPRYLTFPYDEIQSAAKQQEIRLVRSRHNIVDRAGLRSVAMRLLDARKELQAAKYPQTRLKVSPRLLKALEAALTAETVRYTQFFSSLLAHKRRPASGETVFFLKNSSVQIPVGDAEMTLRLRIPITIPGVELEPQTRGESASSLRRSLEVSRLLNKDLREEVERLQKIVKLVEMRLEKEVEGLKNRSSALEEVVNKFGKFSNKISAQSKKVRILNVIGGCKNGPGCLTQMRIVAINETAVYTLTLGGGAGGIGLFKNAGWQSGGRGAVVAVSARLTKGTQLSVVAGCGGGRGSGSMYGGFGGNATIVADRGRGLLLAIAGGGGGAADWSSGVNGRAGAAASGAWAQECQRSFDPDLLLQRHFPGRHGGRGWSDVRARVLQGSAGDVVGTGGTMNSGGGGGGGGGFNGGGSYANFPGGGGGSFCNETAASSCSIEEGGNFFENGFVVFEKHLSS